MKDSHTIQKQIEHAEQALHHAGNHLANIVTPSAELDEAYRLVWKAIRLVKEHKEKKELV